MEKLLVLGGNNGITLIVDFLFGHPKGLS